MITLTCCLRFANGEKASAAISAETLFDDGLVLYYGAVERLPLKPVRASGIELKAYFKSFARELKAQFSLQLDETAPALPEGEGEDVSPVCNHERSWKTGETIRDGF